jgi:hypothetical protein
MNIDWVEPVARPDTTRVAAGRGPEQTVSRLASKLSPTDARQTLQLHGLSREGVDGSVPPWRVATKS